MYVVVRVFTRSYSPRMHMYWLHNTYYVGAWWELNIPCAIPIGFCTTQLKSVWRLVLDLRIWDGVIILVHSSASPLSGNHHLGGFVSGPIDKHVKKQNRFVCGIRLRPNLPLPAWLVPINKDNSACIYHQRRYLDFRAVSHMVTSQSQNNTHWWFSDK